MTDDEIREATKGVIECGNKAIKTRVPNAERLKGADKFARRVKDIDAYALEREIDGLTAEPWDE